MRRITTLALAALLLAFTGAACGGDDDSSGSDTTQAADGGSTSDGGSTTDGGGDGGVTDAGFLDEDCQFLLAGLNPLAGLASGADTDVEDLSSQMQAVADDAPDEIQDAMSTIADAYAEMADALKGVDLTDTASLSDPEVAQKMAGLQDTFGEDFQAATDTVSQYITDNCSSG